MAIKIKPLVVTLTNSSVAILTAGANDAITISKILACNTDTSARSVTIYHDDTGGRGAVTATEILKAYPISAGASPTLPLSSLFLSNGSILYALADTGSVVNLSINYTIDAQ